MALTRRWLPVEEWGLLEASGVAGCLEDLKAVGARIVVVEDDGVLVGSWVFFQQWHAEGLAIEKSHRTRADVWAHLADAANELAGVSVMTAALDDRVRRAILRFGGHQLPGDHYVLRLPVPRSLSREDVCQQLS